MQCEINYWYHGINDISNDFKKESEMDMALKLNKDGFLYAQERIKVGEVDTLKGSWANHKATENEEDVFLNNHYLKEYGQWFLAIDTNVDANDKHHYKLPYGDLGLVHKDGLEEVEKKAKKEGLSDIADAARQLLELIDKTEH